jgi:hypothetical protein
MGVRFHTVQYPDLHRYDPEFNEDGTEKHITCDGARFHVISYGGGFQGGMRCSEPKCEINKRCSDIEER